MNKVLALIVGAILVVASQASATSLEGNVCMGTLFKAVTGQKLNCTANDVTIAKAISVSPASCNSGELFDLTATFEVKLSGGGSSQTRYDLGLYFDIAGDPEHDGAYTGNCSVSDIESGDAGFFTKDGDTCGDINTAHNPIYPNVVFHNVLCADTDGDGFLNLPNCTSWRQPGANDLCVGPLTCIPGTSSKCNCDANFNVPVVVELPNATVTKDSVQATVNYHVSVTNSTSTRTLNCTAICDDTYGAVAGSGCAAGSSSITTSASTCVVPKNLAPGASYACDFDVVVPAPGSSSPVTDIVTVKCVDAVNGSAINPADSAVVTIDLPQ